MTVHRTDRDVAMDCLAALGNHHRDDYQSWLHVGMCCKAAGLSFDDWATWSASSPKWDKKVAQRKWNSFNGGGLTLGSLVHLAKADGAAIDTSTTTSDRPGLRTKLDWDSEIGPRIKVAVNAAESSEPLPNDFADLESEFMLTHYLETLYHPSEFVSTVTSALLVGDKWGPVGKGNFKTTAAELIEAVNTSDDVHVALPGINPDAGAWCRINPMDGKGVTDTNVTEYRHVLVESDDMPIEQQYAMYKKLNLPIAALVTSGRASLHAIVRISAGKDLSLYKRRVEHLYRVLLDNGFKIDKANRNPSRLSRLPGVNRGEERQALVATNIGADTYDEWINYLESLEEDDLPAVVKITTDIIDNPPPMRPELIEGILRTGHCLLLSGPSKAGKSYCLIQLGLSVDTGATWLGHKILHTGPVLIVNLEVDEASYLNRISRTAKRLNLYPGQLEVWTLRGYHVTLSTLIPKIVTRLNKKAYAVIIIDPIYKLLEGDENSNGDMAKFWLHFDRLCKETGASVALAHHFSKGVQGGKASIDRSSGAGVFGRAPDGVVTLTPVDVSEETLPDGQFAFQVDYSLREFKPRRPENVIYDNPLHTPVEIDAFGDAKVVGHTQPGRPPKYPKEVILAAADTASLAAEQSGQPLTVTAIRDQLDPSKKTRLYVVEKWVREGNSHYEFAPDSSTIIVPKKVGQNDTENVPF